MPGQLDGPLQSHARVRNECIRQKTEEGSHVLVQKLDPARISLLKGRLEMCLLSSIRFEGGPPPAVADVLRRGALDTRRDKSGFRPFPDRRLRAFMRSISALPVFLEQGLSLALKRFFDRTLLRLSVVNLDRFEVFETHV